MFYLRGIIWDLQKNWAQAIQDYSEAIRLNPQHAKSFKERGVSYSKQGEIEQALKDYSSAILLNPQYFHVYYLRGSLKKLQGDLNEAKKDMQEALRLIQELPIAARTPIIEQIQQQLTQEFPELK
ncbi:MAG: tetratricopeptide repeat protein [Planctomycetota bacterium]